MWFVYSKQNRCQRCDHLLSDSSQNYGSYCAKLLGLGQTNSLYSALSDSQGTYDENGNRVILDNQSQLAYTEYVNKYMIDSYATTAGTEISPRETLDLLEFTMDDLRRDPEKLKSYIQKVSNGRGINTDMQINAYQILYSTWEKPPMYQDKNTWEWIFKPTGPNNRYSNYEFNTLDALNWLIQTGGNVNFVLQLRDVQYMKDSDGEVDEWAIKDRIADWQDYSIKNNVEYDKFDGAYNGNFVYDLSDYIYRDMLQGVDMIPKLKRFLDSQVLQGDIWS